MSHMLPGTTLPDSRRLSVLFLPIYFSVYHIGKETASLFITFNVCGPIKNPDKLKIGHGVRWSRILVEKLAVLKLVSQ
jgi:hypothetical protein